MSSGVERCRAVSSGVEGCRGVSRCRVWHLDTDEHGPGLDGVEGCRGVSSWSSWHGVSRCRVGVEVWCRGVEARAQDEGGSRTLRRSAGGCTTRLGAAGTRGTMWKTASASPPSGATPASRRPHPQRTLHKDRTGGDLFLFRFHPSHSREVSVFYLFTLRGCEPKDGAAG